MQDSRYGHKFSYWQPAHSCSQTDGSLRKLILDESKSVSQHYRRKPQQRYYKEPSFPGTAAFDILTGTVLPPTRKKPCASPFPCTSLAYDDNLELAENVDTWSDYVYHSRVLAELEEIKVASAPIPQDIDASSRSESAFTSDHPLSQVGTNIVLSEASVDNHVSLAETLSVLGNDSVGPEVENSQISPHVLACGSYNIYSDLVEKLSRLWPDHRPDESTIDTGPATQIPLKADLLAILSGHHDFFVVSQHPSAPWSLRQLAVKYAMPDQMWRRTIKRILDVLAVHSIESGPLLAEFVSTTCTWVDVMSEEVPQMADEWSMIKYNIREYFGSLKADGMDVQTDLTDQWAYSYSAATRQMRAIRQPIAGTFFGDDESCERYFDQHLTKQAVEGLLDHVPTVTLPSANEYIRTALLMMSGWLAVGRKIATSFHAFVQTFLFLGLVSDPLYGH